MRHDNYSTNWRSNQNQNQHFSWRQDGGTSNRQYAHAPYQGQQSQQ